MKIPNKKEIQEIVSNNLSVSKLKDFMKIYEDYTKEPFSFLVNNTTLPSDNLLRFRKNLLARKSNQQIPNLTKQSSI